MERLAYIDGIKGIAAIIVLFSHYKLAFFFKTWRMYDILDLPFVNLCVNGNFAVCLFLLISGFLMGRSLHKKNNSFRDLTFKILHRYLRLALPITPVLLVVGLLYYSENIYLPLYCSKAGVTWIMNEYTSLSVDGLAKAIFLSPLGMDYGYLAVLWMMKYIFLGGVVIMLVHAAVINHTMALKLPVAFVGCLGMYFISIYYSMVVLGFVLYLVSEERGKKKTIFSKYILALLTLIALYNTDIASPLQNAIAAIFVLLTIKGFCSLQKLFSSQVVVWLGRISFHVYLWHWCVMSSLTSFVLYKWSSGIHSIVCDVVVTSITLLATLLLSIGSYKLEMLTSKIWKKRLAA